MRDRVGLSDGELGIVLACAAVGSILAMPVAGGRAARIGSRRATRVAFALMCLASGVIALAPSLLVLCLLAFFYGASMGSLDVTMNAHGVAVERRYGRSILASFHAAFSIGGLAGGVIGALAAAIGVDVRVQLALVAVVSAAIGLTWSRRFLGGDADALGSSEPVFVRPPRRLLALGALAFACLLIEGASADWSAVYLRDELGTTAAIAAIGFTAFSITMTLGRVFGDRLVDRFGPEADRARRRRPRGRRLRPGARWPPRRCPRSSASPASAPGCPASCRSSSAPRGTCPGMSAGVGLAAVSSTGYLGFLVGPPIIGGLAELVGLPGALAVVVLFAAAVALLAPTTRFARPGAAVEREPQTVAA